MAAPERWRCTWPPATLLVSLALAVVLIAPVASHSVIIANSANITQCLGTTRLRIVMVDCITHIGAEWNWTVETASQGGPMETLGLFSDPESGNRQCIDEELRTTSCEGAPSWRWNPSTLQLQLTLKEKTWCLGLIGKELLMEKCHTLNGTTSDDQNGYGAPAEQTWVLMPTTRPQISLLDRLTFPLRSVGRHIVDSKGLRVKLVGVNWLGAHMKQLVNNGLDRAPLERIVKTMKYMGFNSVRLNYASVMMNGTDGIRPMVPDMTLLDGNPELKNLSAMEVFDKVVEAITDEGLLVVICRHMHEPGWCCRGDDGSELWYGEKLTTEDWLDDLTSMAERYQKNDRVIGVDIFNEPRMRESDDTFPWWGVPAWLAGLLGIRIADWRKAAARGAVAVWQGDPDALVIIEGQLYASNLEHVLDRPLNLAQDCLHSRIVYSSHEFFWHWKIDKFFMHLADTFRPFTFSSRLKDTLRQAYEVGDEDEFGSTPSFAEVGHRAHADFSRRYNGGVGLISYDEWSQTRDRAVFYMDDDNKAPVWVSAFGTSRKADNAWWEYVIKYFREKDANWCYWPMDPIALPSNFNGTRNAFQSETYGLFDTSRYDYSAVVGWKLQDLLSIMAPSEDAPVKLDPPKKCEFDAQSNLAASLQETGTFEFLSTMSWTPQAVIDVLCLLLVICLVPCLLCLGCFLAMKTRSQDSARSEVFRRSLQPEDGKAEVRDRRYEPLVSNTASAPSTYFRSGLGIGMGSPMGSFKTKVRPTGSMTSADFDDRRVEPREDFADNDDSWRNTGGFMCCTTKRPRRSPTRTQALASASTAQSGSSRRVP